MKTFYLESSAALKLFQNEPESEALIGFISEASTQIRLISSQLTRLEVVGKLARFAEAPLRASKFFTNVRLIPVSNSVLEDAVISMQFGLRSLDAIHHATIRTFAADLDAVVCYDLRLKSAIEQLGIEVVSPGANPAG
jgi:predicted nucleic acid-binding protein